MPKIYTRTGDAGQTGLWGGSRVPKHNPRVAAYGEVDELNCALGAVLAGLEAGKSWAPLRDGLVKVQAELFSVGAVLATPAGGKPPALPSGAIARLEKEIDAMTADLPALKNFVLPGGTPTASALHLARAVCRRAERAVSSLGALEPLPEGVLVYLNRLSDHLFTAARWANARAGRPETLWKGA